MPRPVPAFMSRPGGAREAGALPVPATRTYRWSARQGHGPLVQGVCRAGGEHQVRARLRLQGLVPVSVVAVRQRAQPVRTRDVVLLTRQLATLLGAGVPLLQSLHTARQALAHEGLGPCLDQVHADLERGLPLSSALRRQPQVFSPLYAHLVEAGEACGRLDALLDRLATDLEKTEALRSKLRAALVYPAVVLGVAALVLVVVMVAVVPSFQSVFASFGAELPWPTRWVMALSHGLVTLGPGLLALALVMAWGFRRAWRRSTGLRRRVEQLVLRLPGVAALLHGAAVARWSRTLSGLLAAGLPLVDAMGAARGAAGYFVYADACGRLRDELARGSSLHGAMAALQLFSPMVLQMCAVGEESGELALLLSKVADFHEREVDDRVASLSSLLEPGLIVLLGAVIGALVLALYLPIFQMGQIT